MLVVVLFHAEFDFIPSGFIGVDIFFVISGYLILGSLIRQTSDGCFTLNDFWARRIRRLIPAATISTISILFLGWFIYPADQLEILARDSIAASAYFSNWNFLLNQVSYWDISLASPFLHYWSLSVEEQFYIFFPILFAILLFFSQKFGFKLNQTLLLYGLGLLSSVSLVGMLFSNTDSSNLYFNTTFRLWEFGLGGLGSFLVIKPFRRIQLLKLALLLSMALLTLIPNNFQYPGIATLIPVGLAAFYLALPDFNKVARNNPLLSSLDHLGDISYSVYLWHWPVILYLTYLTYGIDANPKMLDLPHQFFILIVSVILGWSSYRFVEEPFRHRSIRPATRKKWLLFGAAALSASLIISLVTPLTNFPKLAAAPRVFVNHELDPEILSDEGELQAAIDLLSKPDLQPATSVTSLQPSLDQLLKSKAKLYEDNCHLEVGNSSLQTNCVYGDTNSDKSIFLIGDSHAATWFPAIDIAARELGMKLIPRTKSSCGLFEVTLPGDEVETSKDCYEYREALIAELKASDPLAVVVAQLYNNPGTEIESNEQRAEINNAHAKALKQQISENAIKDLPLLFVADIPQLSFEPSRCLASQSPDECHSGRLTYLAPASFLLEVVGENDSYKYVNLGDFICTGDKCFATNSEHIIYRDRHHLTNAFSESLSFVWTAILSAL